VPYSAVIPAATGIRLSVAAYPLSHMENLNGKYET
jgi:hypothetical protein